jgi:hypothetical protein
MQVYCLFPDCKFPNDHHNTADHPCGICKVPGHSRALHGRPEDTSEILKKDGRGLQYCRLCKTENHLTTQHPCDKCGALGHSERYCDTSEREYDPMHLSIMESVGDFLLKSKWCTVNGCCTRHLHVASDHPCNTCGYRHDVNGVQHYDVTCPYCRKISRLFEEHLMANDSTKEDECNICMENRKLCKLYCGHTLCYECTNNMLYTKSKTDVEENYGVGVNVSTHKQARDVYAIARALFGENNNKIYTLINNDDIIYKVSRTSIDSKLDAIGYQQMNDIETSAVHNWMITYGYVFIKH